MTYDDPSEAEAAFYNAILVNAVQEHGDEVNAMILAYWGSPLDAAIGTAAGDRAIRVEFVDGPTSQIRVEYGLPDEHDAFVLLDNPTIPKE